MQKQTMTKANGTIPNANSDATLPIVQIFLDTEFKTHTTVTLNENLQVSQIIKQLKDKYAWNSQSRIAEESSG